MSQDHTEEVQVEPADMHAEVSQVLENEFDEAFESAGDHHRMAAHHFAAAAKHQLAAADADDDGDADATARHAFLAYREQLTAVQFAEIAVMDNESLDEEPSEDDTN